ncbi:hypothetical protein RJT34_01642 [Clitoria ternatea]|uniref:Uncharacterized protein n=1 Tax=Clitoria ternatea TaxID=43366 RepID=A0AAN9PZY2_CLITE
MMAEALRKKKPEKRLHTDEEDFSKGQHTPTEDVPIIHATITSDGDDISTGVAYRGDINAMLRCDDIYPVGHSHSRADSFSRTNKNHADYTVRDLVPYDQFPFDLSLSSLFPVPVASLVFVLNEPQVPLVFLVFVASLHNIPRLITQYPCVTVSSQ